MSGLSVRDLTDEDAMEHLYIYAPQEDDERELSWWVEHASQHGWLLAVKDDGGDVRFWKIRLGKLGEEV